MQLLLDRIASPIGEILFVGDAGGLTVALDFDEFEPRMRVLLARYAPGADIAPGRLPWARAAIDRYFTGDPAALSTLRLHAGGTPLQNAVWRALQSIPAGQTRSYAAVATSVGNPRAVRAVANANARNPIAIVVPCHRVIGKDGALTGYAGGLWRKEWLLRHEGVLH